MDKQQIQTNENDYSSEKRKYDENFISPGIAHLLQKPLPPYSEIKTINAPFKKKKGYHNHNTILFSHKAKVINDNTNQSYSMSFWEIFHLIPISLFSVEEIMIELLFIRKRIIFVMDLTKFLINSKDELDYETTPLLQFLLKLLSQGLKSLYEDLTSPFSILLSDYHSKNELRATLNFQRLIQNLKQESELISPLENEYSTLNPSIQNENDLLFKIDNLITHVKTISLSLFYQKALNGILIVNHLLDIILIEDIFTKTIERSITYENQPYFLSLKNLSYLQVLNLVESKRQYLRKKMF